MISLETLSALLSIGEAELIEELILALLASPQLAIFFEKFPGLKQAMLRDVPRWKAEINAELKATPVPETLADEFQLFQRAQLLSHHDFSQQLPEILEALTQLSSPFLEEAQRLLQHTDAHQLSGAQHTLFLQRWRLSLTLQTLTLNEQLMEQQRERLMAELQQRMALSGQLAPLLSGALHLSGPFSDAFRAAAGPIPLFALDELNLDGFVAGAEMGRLLLAQGHQRFGYLQQSCCADPARIDGFCSVLAAADKRLDQSLIAADVGDEHDSG